MSETGRSLDEYLALGYPFHAIADPDGGYVITFPDLPGCITQADRIEEIPAMAEDARRLWLESEYEDGHDIPLPSYPEEYSGKFNVRLPRSLHRQLAEAAQREGVSLNHYVTTLLSRGLGQDEVPRRSRTDPRQVARGRPATSRRSQQGSG
ncbi:MAG: type II toxin-antitoxin system HicB family antitoxin [Chloroflexi bacterium]|nr:type II toxin-antitoxin system HicB family antitoxin [Chloroflexota bacterium]